MDFKVIRELQRIESEKKCNSLTCVHYVGGLCVGCETDECDFTEPYFTQD